MGLDILNAQGAVNSIDSNVIDPLLDRLKGEIIPALEAVIQRRVDSAIEQASNVIRGALDGVQATEDKAAADIKPILELAVELKALSTEFRALVAQLNGGAAIEVRLRPKVGA